MADIFQARGYRKKAHKISYFANTMNVYHEAFMEVPTARINYRASEPITVNCITKKLVKLKIGTIFDP